MADAAAVQRLRQRHGQGIAATAVSLGLNLDALRMLPKHDATRAIELAAAVPHGLHGVSEEDHALLLAVGAPASSGHPHQPDPGAAGHPNAQVFNEQPPQQDHHQVQEPPGTVTIITRSRSRSM